VEAVAATSPLFSQPVAHLYHYLNERLPSLQVEAVVVSVLSFGLFVWEEVGVAMLAYLLRLVVEKWFRSLVLEAEEVPLEVPAAQAAGGVDVDPG
jgi:hypothetical protein